MQISPMAGVAVVIKAKLSRLVINISWSLVAVGKQRPPALAAHSPLPSSFSGLRFSVATITGAVPL